MLALADQNAASAKHPAPPKTASGQKSSGVTIASTRNPTHPVNTPGKNTPRYDDSRQRNVFLQVDPLVAKGWDAYGYAGHDPVGAFDVWGLEKCQAPVGSPGCTFPDERDIFGDDIFAEDDDNGLCDGMGLWSCEWWMDHLGVRDGGAGWDPPWVPPDNPDPPDGIHRACCAERIKVRKECDPCRWGSFGDGKVVDADRHITVPVPDYCKSEEYYPQSLPDNAKDIYTFGCSHAQLQKCWEARDFFKECDFQRNEN